MLTHIGTHELDLDAKLVTHDVKDFYPTGSFANLKKHASLGSDPLYMACIAKDIAEFILENLFIIVGDKIYKILQGSGIRVPLSNSLAGKELATKLNT